MSDFDLSKERGLPGETVLWQGSPAWRSIVTRVFHIRAVAVYLALFVLWQVATSVYDGKPLTETAYSALWMALLIGICCAIFALLALATERTTVYTVTTERVVLHYGIALPMTLNIPFRKIESVASKIYADGHGDFPLRLVEGEKIAYPILWPHARPWRMKRPEPMLRGIPNAAEVGTILARAIAAAASRPKDRVTEAPPQAAVQQMRPASAVPSEPEQRERVARFA